MIVFDLRCTGGHVFEAWFGSSAAFEEQRATGLLACPLCGDDGVVKAIMAPNIAAKGNGVAASQPDRRTGPSPAAIKTALRALAAAQAGVLEKSEWVGAAFADRARAMHAGEETPAPIHGRATRAEAEALVDEGVPVAPLPLPVMPPDAVN